ACRGALELGGYPFCKDARFVIANETGQHGRGRLTHLIPHTNLSTIPHPVTTIGATPRGFAHFLQRGDFLGMPIRQKTGRRSSRIWYHARARCARELQRSRLRTAPLK